MCPSVNVTRSRLVRYHMGIVGIQIPPIVFTRILKRNGEEAQQNEIHEVVLVQERVLYPSLLSNHEENDVNRYQRVGRDKRPRYCASGTRAYG